MIQKTISQITRVRRLLLIALVLVVSTAVGTLSSQSGYAQVSGQIDATEHSDGLSVLASPDAVDDLGATEDLDAIMILDGDIAISVGDYQKMLAGGFEINLWCNSQFLGRCQIPYDFDPGVDLYKVELATLEWERVSNVDFIQCAFYDCPGFDDYIHFQTSDGNNSQVGRQGGRQDINIASMNEFTIVHELGHALGLLHEHSRPDRDRYISVISQNILGDKQSQLARIDGMRTYGRYDFDSIMHYGRCAFSIDSTECQKSGGTKFQTIDLRPDFGSFSSVIGQRDHLSLWDIRVMSFLYPLHNWRFVNGTYTEDAESGLLFYPFKTIHKGMNGAGGVPDNGTLWIHPGDYSASGIYNRPVIWRNTHLDPTDVVILQ